MKPSPHTQQGFSLVELAVVMVIIGIFMTLGLKVAMSTMDNTAYSVTKSKQELIKTALIGYLRTYGRLPCPDNAAGVATGSEAATCFASAGEAYGIVPWQTLGIPRDAVLDGWGSFFSYRVANGTGTSKNWTAKVSATTDLTVNELKMPTAALSIQELNAAGDAYAAAPTTTSAVVVILSHGKNGFGAKTTKVGDRMPVSDAGADETTNASGGTALFVLRPSNDSASAFGGAYDDLVAYLSPQDLLQPLINEGSLRACLAYCTSSNSSVCAGGTGTCSCAAVGVAGIPSGASPCSGTCGTCMASPALAGCVPVGPLPVGATPTSCL
ncbi:prepilin-type N-terminal cleavage/methylation domain-containing protein [Dechloromonas sp. HYN0024]|uniref:prepilin-type N-terminal cleavage/methylation domain-containing protein n=1 Tax=Dechloromonas sp. HYN0024 TaxID=2231055 RepID=UPI000E439AD7|nr:type II secretion system protein [Dechloromonas sp. HYN0024]AXS79885.1 type II secretion system protein [Dechloromonas sp. HYN0024]